MLSSVDLPQPDGPSMQTNSPSRTSRSMSLEHVDLACRPAETSSRRRGPRAWQRVGGSCAAACRSSAAVAAALEASHRRGRAQADERRSAPCRRPPGRSGCRRCARRRSGSPRPELTAIISAATTTSQAMPSASRSPTMSCGSTAGKSTCAADRARRGRSCAPALQVDVGDAARPRSSRVDGQRQDRGEEDEEDRPRGRRRRTRGSRSESRPAARSGRRICDERVDRELGAALPAERERRAGRPTTTASMKPQVTRNSDATAYRNERARGAPSSTSARTTSSGPGDQRVTGRPTARHATIPRRRTSAPPRTTQPARSDAHRITRATTSPNPVPASHPSPTSGLRRGHRRCSVAPRRDYVPDRSSPRSDTSR